MVRKSTQRNKNNTLSESFTEENSFRNNLPIPNSQPTISCNENKSINKSGEKNNKAKIFQNKNGEVKICSKELLNGNELKKNVPGTNVLDFGIDVEPTPIPKEFVEFITRKRILELSPSPVKKFKKIIDKKDIFTGLTSESDYSCRNDKLNNLKKCETILTNGLKSDAELAKLNVTFTLPLKAKICNDFKQQSVSPKCPLLKPINSPYKEDMSVGEFSNLMSSSSNDVSLPVTQSNILDSLSVPIIASPSGIPCAQKESIHLDMNESAGISNILENFFSNTPPPSLPPQVPRTTLPLIGRFDIDKVSPTCRQSWLPKIEIEHSLNLRNHDNSFEFSLTAGQRVASIPDATSLCPSELPYSSTQYSQIQKSLHMPEVSPIRVDIKKDLNNSIINELPVKSFNFSEGNSACITDLKSCTQPFNEVQDDIVLTPTQYYSELLKDLPITYITSLKGINQSHARQKDIRYNGKDKNACITDLKSCRQPFNEVQDNIVLTPTQYYSELLKDLPITYITPVKGINQSHARQKDIRYSGEDKNSTLPFICHDIIDINNCAEQRETIDSNENLSQSSKSLLCPDSQLNLKKNIDRSCTSCEGGAITELTVETDFNCGSGSLNCLSELPYSSTQYSQSQKSLHMPEVSPIRVDIKKDLNNSMINESPVKSLNFLEGTAARITDLKSCSQPFNEVKDDIVLTPTQYYPIPVQKDVSFTHINPIKGINQGHAGMEDKKYNAKDKNSTHPSISHDIVDNNKAGQRQVIDSEENLSLLSNNDGHYGNECSMFAYKDKNSLAVTVPLLLRDNLQTQPDAENTSFKDSPNPSIKIVRAKKNVDPSIQNTSKVVNLNSTKTICIDDNNCKESMLTSEASSKNAEFNERDIIRNYNANAKMIIQNIKKLFIAKREECLNDKSVSWNFNFEINSGDNESEKLHFGLNLNQPSASLPSAIKYSSFKVNIKGEKKAKKKEELNFLFNSIGNQKKEKLIDTVKVNNIVERYPTDSKKSYSNVTLLNLSTSDESDIENSSIKRSPKKLTKYSATKLSYQSNDESDLSSDESDIGNSYIRKSTSKTTNNVNRPTKPSYLSSSKSNVRDSDESDNKFSIVEKSNAKKNSNLATKQPYLSRDESDFKKHSTYKFTNSLTEPSYISISKSNIKSSISAKANNNNKTAPTLKNITAKLCNVNKDLSDIDRVGTSNLNRIFTVDRKCSECKKSADKKNLPTEFIYLSSENSDLDEGSDNNDDIDLAFDGNGKIILVKSSEKSKNLKLSNKIRRKKHQRKILNNKFTKETN